MSTSPISFRRRARRGALALIVSAILVPASSALAQGGDTRPTTPACPGTRIPSGWSATPRPTTPACPAAEDLATRRRHPGRLPGHAREPADPAAVAAHAPEASGFDWTSAGIGAGAAGVLIVVSLGGAAAASRLRFRTVRSRGPASMRRRWWPPRPSAPGPPPRTRPIAP